MSYKKTKHELKQSISEILEKLGESLIDPVPYDTAWVARVPQAQNRDSPAFPLSLDWLRDHQLENGSWGADKPFSAHSNTLNTLAATIALAQWNSPKDEHRIKHGIGALWDLAARLKSEIYDGVGFELILPALVKEAQIYGLSLPYEYYRQYDEKAEKKLKLITAELKGRTEYDRCKPTTWWHSLEILGHDSEIVFDENMIQFSLYMLSKSGSVGESPSATAYALRAQRLKGVDIPEAENYLKKVYSLQAGGIPHTFSIDVFELAFSLDFFIKAGFSMKSPGLKEAAHRLSERCDPREGIGFSSHLQIPDSDDTAVALNVLHQAGYQVSVNYLLRFFNDTHFSTFHSESHPSVSVNINSLPILRVFEDTKEAHMVIKKVEKFLETTVTSKHQVFTEDKWNSSPYYCTSRAVFNLNGLKDNIVNHCISFFLQTQNNDGGWGKDNFSTAEETAYVVLALCHGLKYNYLIPENVLRRANAFLSGSECNSKAQLWIAKVLYRPTLVAESAVLAARYALNESFQVISIRSALTEVKPDFMEVKLNCAGNQQWCHGVLLYTVPDFDLDFLSDQITKTREQVIGKLMELKLIKGGDKINRSLIPEGCLLSIRKYDISDEYLLFHALSSMAVLIYDDIVDKNGQLFHEDPHILKRASLVFLDILKGKYTAIDNIESLKFPNFIPLCKLFLHVRQGIVGKKNTDEFLREVKTLFSFFIKDIDNRINGLALSSKQFLEISKITNGFDVFFCVRCMFEGVNLFYLNDNKIFEKFKVYAAKAARLALDIFSFPRDAAAERPYENYVLVKQAELNCSVEDAFKATVKLFNKLQIRMIDLKRTIQNDLCLRDDTNLLQAISIAESMQYGSLDWASKVRRYSQKTDISILMVRKQFEDVDLSEFLRRIYDQRNTSIGSEQY